MLPFFYSENKEEHVSHTSLLVQKLIFVKQSASVKLFDRQKIIAQNFLILIRYRQAETFQLEIWIIQRIKLANGVQ